MRKSLFILILAVIGFNGNAHTSNQNYVYLQVYESLITIRVELRNSDLESAFGYVFPKGSMPSTNDPRIDTLIMYIQDQLNFTSNMGSHELKFLELGLMELPSSDYTLFNFQMTNTDQLPQYFDIENELLTAEFTNHESLVIIEHNWLTGTFDNEALPSLVYNGGGTQRLDLSDSTIFNGFVAMIKSGIYHIWIGIDHILFLIALLIPSVIIYRKEEKERLLLIPYTSFDPVDEFKKALWVVVKVITLFTVAHSITLSLAALQIVVLPSRLVESIIAFSIILAALHNIRPLLLNNEWLFVFAFGLFHGFGFASVLAEQSKEGEYLVYSLLGFNIGVEIGQVVIILIAFPILFFLRNWSRYNLIVVLLSLFLSVVALYWFIERAFDVDLPAGAIMWSILGMEPR